MSLVQRIRNAYRQDDEPTSDAKDMRESPPSKKSLAPFRELADELDPPAVEPELRTRTGAHARIAERVERLDNVDPTLVTAFRAYPGRAWSCSSWTMLAVERTAN